MKIKMSNLTFSDFGKNYQFPTEQMGLALSARSALHHWRVIRDICALYLTK